MVVHSSLQLGICFLEELATSSSFGDKTFSLLMLTPGADFFFFFFTNYLVRAVTACHALWSRAGLRGFRS